MTSKIIFILVITAMISYSVATNLPPVCQSSEQCPPGYCCTLQPMRYSMPACNKIVQEDQICRPQIDIINTTLQYPNQKTLKIWNVHYIMCPCDKGLFCDRSAGGRCKQDKSNEVWK